MVPPTAGTVLPILTDLVINRPIDSDYDDNATVKYNADPLQLSPKLAKYLQYAILYTIQSPYIKCSLAGGLVQQTFISHAERRTRDKCLYVINRKK